MTAIRATAATKAPVAPTANAPKTAVPPVAYGPGTGTVAPVPAEQSVGHRPEGTRLRAGLVGLGAMGRNHARILSSLEGVEFVGAVDPAGDPHGSVPAVCGVPVLSEVADLLALGVDYAVVACPTALHEAVGLQLAAHDVCALIEKPLAHTPQAARRLVDAFEERGLVAGVGHVERFNPALQQLRARLEAGELGEVFQVVTRRQGPFPHRIADVGVVKDLATHDIDLTSWITGQAYASLAARTVSKSGREHEDMVAVVGSLTDGTMVSHLVNWLSPLKERFTAVTGERGCFVADTLTADLTFHANGAVATEWEALRAFRGVAEGDTVRYAFAKREPLLVEHERFRDAVRNGTGQGSGIVTAREGLRTVQVSAAVLESADEAAPLMDGARDAAPLVEPLEPVERMAPVEPLAPAERMEPVDRVAAAEAVEVPREPVEVTPTRTERTAPTAAEHTA
ncbi:MULTISPECIES: Gfo/Idh/MocA family protein [unclassified Streptomyces]|uniref:Gfo/Idh/MocA family protein n=2 Tax=Streptomyces TaxID=1883 RepID=UPI001615A7D6|nr:MULTISPECIES: Gfo/Idh/MocA family oxidoreductase [unclassified Streptomyces]MBQ0867604.1 Gfo/Idh/MocA family oxidoreductase [Streptomyces sp. RK75]MBQ1119551.1 Gfo/Idh/MocA family oxidoreductase [Streptomyces sp. B15]